jgi:hypothetical protein
MSAKHGLRFPLKALGNDDQRPPLYARSKGPSSRQETLWADQIRVNRSEKWSMTNLLEQ